MADVKVMSQIQNEKRTEIRMNGNPSLNAEDKAIKGQSRITLDEPPTAEKIDPLR